MTSIYNIKPFQYIHILDKNLNNKRLLEGPINYAVQDHELVVDSKIFDMIIIPNLYQVKILNPVVREEGKIALDKYGNPKNKWGCFEVRTREKFNDPFPLYPGETVSESKPLEFIPKDEAYHLKCVLNFTDDDNTSRSIGAEWLLKGPKYFINRPEVEVVKKVKSHVVISPNALKLRALRNFTIEVNEEEKVERLAGEEWLVYNEGSYLPNVFEEVVESVVATILDNNTAVKLKAKNNFTDIYGIKRNAGEEWIITKDQASYHTCGIFEEVLSVQNRVVLNINQYVIIQNPYNSETNKNDYGKMKLVIGEADFFLNAGEIIDQIKNVFVLTEKEALLVQAIENLENYLCGEKWMINGPCRYVPPVEVKVLEKRNIIPLDKNEGIYVRNKTTGEVTTHIGSSYMLKPNEVLWEKKMPENIERIYLKDQNLKSRDRSRVITYKCPFNSVMQVYNLKTRTNRIVMGPNLLILNPEEEFCLMQLSGSTPKVEGVVETLYLKLGPNFSTDEFLVETSDHTRLILRIGYNWYFDVSNEEEAESIFSVRDFIGDLCSTMASKIRSYAATLTFEDFHKKSDFYIKKSVFGEKDGVIQSNIRNDNCRLIVTDVDIKSVIPSDPNTQLLLQKSVSLAIELTTKTIEQEFNIQAQIKEQEFKGELKMLEINNKINYLKKELDLNKLKVISEIIENTGLSRAQAMAKKDADLIESLAQVKYAQHCKESKETESKFEIEKIIKKNANEYLELSEKQRLQIKETSTINQIESNKFEEIITSIGPETIVEIAKAGPELQAKLLKGLNLSGYILTDGNNPINLFNVASGLTSNNK